MKTYYNRNESNNKLLYQQNFGFKTNNYLEMKLGRNLISKIPNTFEIKKEEVNKTEITSPISIG